MRAKTTGGLTGNMLPIFVQDSTKTDGSGLSGLVYNSAGLVAEYRRAGSASWTAITLVSGASLGSFTSGGWVADGSLAGAYEVGIPNAAFGTNVPWVVVRFRGAANMVPCQYYIELDAIAYSDPIRAGLTALPNANANAAGGILTFGNSTGQINPSSGAVPTSDGLKPTTAGRTLDVSATGEAGIDWANIGSPTTTVNLSGTTVGTVAAVTAVSTGGITAASIAADAIGASELAADAVTEIVNGVLTTAMTEAYAADGSAPTVAQALHFLIAALTEFSISGTTITLKKLDGTTTAATLTINSSTTPTSVTRAT